MVVLVIETVTPGLRGELTRWLTRIGDTTFVGQLSGEVRDALWDMVVCKCESGRALMVATARGEPGYFIRLHGHEAQILIDLDGLPALARRDAAWAEAVERFDLGSTPA